MPAWQSPTWVNCGPPAASPMAKARRFEVRSRRSTMIPAGEARDRRHDRRRAGGDDKAPWPDGSVAGAERARVEKARLGRDHPHPEPFEALDRVVWRDASNDVFDAGRDGGEIDLRWLVADA